MIPMESDPDTGAIALCALRYCQGRRTYMPSLVVDWTKRHWESLSLKDRGVILKDLEEFLNSGRDLGDECDRETWNGFHSWILEVNS